MNLAHLRYSSGATDCADPLQYARCKQFLQARAVDLMRRHQTYHNHTHTKIKTQKKQNKTLHQATKYKNKPGSNPALLIHSFSIPVDYTEEQLYWITPLVHLASYPLSGSSQKLKIRDQ